MKLSKLAVTEKYQDLKIGRLLMEYCVEIAKHEGIKKIVLDTNRKLSNAVSLYKKFGFIEVPFDEKKYVEVDLKMELCL